MQRRGVCVAVSSSRCTQDHWVTSSSTLAWVVCSHAGCLDVLLSLLVRACGRVIVVATGCVAVPSLLLMHRPSLLSRGVCACEGGLGRTLCHAIVIACRRQ